MGDILSATEQLRQADVRIICQWIPSHVGIHGNEVADELATAGRLQPQPTVPATLAHVSSLLRGETAKRWRAAMEGNDDLRLAKLYEARRAGDYCAHLPRGDAVQVFRMRVNHELLLASMSKRGWSQSASCHSVQKPSRGHRPRTVLLPSTGGLPKSQLGVSGPKSGPLV